MKAILCVQPAELKLVDRPAPERKPGQVLLRIRRVGLCGTDFHIFGGNQPYLEYPRVMGHELGATVEAADPASGLSPGQLVTVMPYLACGQCHACTRGKPNCCTQIQVLGVHIDGGMSEFLSVPEAAIIPVNGLEPDEAAMIEFLAIGAHAVRRSDAGPGERVLVVGAGPIGIGICLFARLAGASVTLIDTSATRLEYARDKLSIDRTHRVSDDIDALLAAETSGDFFDIVFDATGNRQAMETGFSYVAHGGRYVLVSIVKGDIAFSDPEFHKREMTLLSSRNATADDFRHVIQNIRSGSIPTRALATHRLTLEELPARMPELIEQQGNILKAIASV